MDRRLINTLIVSDDDLEKKKKKLTLYDLNNLKPIKNFDHFIAKNPELFEELFGFPMYKTTKNGKKILNSNELLLDMYLYVNDTRNGGNLIHKNSNSNTYIFNHSDSIDVFGRLMLDTEQQVCMSTSAGSNNEVLSSYLNAKGLDWDSYVLIENNSNNV